MTALDRPYWIEARVERREDWDSRAYPFNLPVVRDPDTLAFHPRVTFIVGENGSGKSTLIEALAVTWGFNAEGGSRNFNFRAERRIRPSRAHPTRSAPRSGLDGYFCGRKASSTSRARSKKLDAEPSFDPPIIDGYGGRSLHEQSHGEAFFALFDNRCHGDGLYILGEPEAALSPQRQLSFLARLHELVLARSQFIIATHSPILLGHLDAWMRQASERGLERVEYEDTEHFQVTRNFLNRRQVFLDVLLAPDDEA